MYTWILSSDSQLSVVCICVFWTIFFCFWLKVILVFLQWWEKAVETWIVSIFIKFKKKNSTKQKKFIQKVWNLKSSKHQSSFFKQKFAINRIWSLANVINLLLHYLHSPYHHHIYDDSIPDFFTFKLIHCLWNKLMNSK